jgi:hypothetical protein
MISTREGSSHSNRAVSVLASAILCGALVGCAGDSSDTCRYEPENCGGGRAGAFCVDNSDCRDTCCTDEANCAGGTCTFVCADDLDCPADMACEHDVCFYACEVDEDCAVGMSCEHDNTVCEWP